MCNIYAVQTDGTQQEVSVFYKVGCSLCVYLSSTLLSVHCVYTFFFYTVGSSLGVHLPST